MPTKTNNQKFVKCQVDHISCCCKLSSTTAPPLSVSVQEAAEVLVSSVDMVVRYVAVEMVDGVDDMVDGSDRLDCVASEKLSFREPIASGERTTGAFACGDERPVRTVTPVRLSLALPPLLLLPLLLPVPLRPPLLPRPPLRKDGGGGKRVAGGVLRPGLLLPCEPNIGGGDAPEADTSSGGGGGATTERRELPRPAKPNGKKLKCIKRCACMWQCELTKVSRAYRSRLVSDWRT